MNDTIEELKKIVDNAKREFEDKPSVTTGRRYSDALTNLTNALKNEAQPNEPMWLNKDGKPID